MTLTKASNGTNLKLTLRGSRVEVEAKHNSLANWGALPADHEIDWDFSWDNGDSQTTIFVNEKKFLSYMKNIQLLNFNPERLETEKFVAMINARVENIFNSIPTAGY